MTSATALSPDGLREPRPWSTARRPDGARVWQSGRNGIAALARCSIVDQEDAPRPGLPCQWVRRTQRPRSTRRGDRHQPQRQLVDEQKRGLGHHRPSDREHLLLAAGEPTPGELAGGAFGEGGKVSKTLPLGCVPAASRCRRVPPTVRFSSTFTVSAEDRALRHQSDALVDPGMGRHRGDVAARRAGPCRAHGKQTGQRHDGGALAGAVGPDEPEDLARPDGKGKTIHCDDVAVAAGQLRHLQHRVAHALLQLPAVRAGGSRRAAHRSSRLSRLCTGRSSSTCGRRARIPAAFGSNPS